MDKNLDQEHFSKELLAKLEYKKLFKEITKCGGHRNWQKNKNTNPPIVEHPTYPSYLRLDFKHLYDFLIRQINQKRLSRQDFQNEIEASQIQWNTFRLGQYRDISSNIVEIGICIAARFLDDPLALLLAQFFEECETAKIRLARHHAFEETIENFLLKAGHIASHHPSEVIQLDAQENDSLPTENIGSINELELVHGEEKWLDPYNLDEILFIARDAELEKLGQFARHDNKFKIWAIEGSSGAGKTRLTIEWINRSKADTLNGWDLHILHKQDRSDPAYWLTWSPSKPTLIIIDYMFGFDQVIENLIGHCAKQLNHKVRLLLLDHVFPRPLHNDKRWGFSLDRSSLNRNEHHFYDLKPLELNETEDQETVLRGIICQRAQIDAQSSAINEAIDYLKKAHSAWHPLFAALAGDALKSGQDFTKWNRRELIDYYLADKRLPWKLDKELLGWWTSYFICVATARRGVTYRDMIDAAEDCESSPTHFGLVKNTCRQIISDYHPTILAPFEPDLLGESLFLLFLIELEDSKVYRKEFYQVFLAGDLETQIQDALEFIGFIERLTRNLLNDDQNQEETQSLWRALFDFLQPLDFPKHNVLRWAISVSLVNIINVTIKVFPIEEIRLLHKKIDLTDLYEADDCRLLYISKVCSMQLFELTNFLDETHTTILSNMYALLKRNCQNDAGDNEEPPLLIASSHDFFQTVTSLIDDYGENVNTALYGGLSVLMKASFFGNTKTVERLLNRGADIHAVTKDGDTSLMWASLKGHTETVELLLNRGADIHAVDNKGLTALTRASGLGHTKILEHLLNRGTKVNDGVTALMFASLKGDAEIVEQLLNQGVDINVSNNNNGRSALISTSGKGHTEIVEQLLNRGADIHAIDNDGITALMFASENGHTETVEQLLNWGADIHSGDNDEITTLMLASMNGYTETVEHLLNRGADIHAIDNDGVTALMFASLNGYTETVEHLLNRGADIHAVDKDGITALKWASVRGHTKTVEHLLNWGAYIHAVDKDGTTGLLASGKEHTKIEEHDIDKAFDDYEKAVEIGDETANQKLVDLTSVLSLFKENNNKSTSQSWAEKQSTNLLTDSWADNPLEIGKWSSPSSDEAILILSYFHQALREAQMLGNLGNAKCQRIRFVPLSFYPEHSLADIEFYCSVKREYWFCSVLVGAKEVVPLNGESPMINDINKFLLNFNAKNSPIDYLRFYCEYIGGNGNSFHIISELDEIKSILNSGEVIPDIVKQSFFNIRHIEGEFRMEGWQYFEACIIYANGFYISKFRLFHNGNVAMEDDDLIAALPVLQRKYDGIFRSALQKKVD